MFFRRCHIPQIGPFSVFAKSSNLLLAILKTDEIGLDALTIPDEMSKIDKVTHSQPVCTAIQIALVDILACWDIKAQGVVGHSSGEDFASVSATIVPSTNA